MTAPINYHYPRDAAREHHREGVATSFQEEECRSRSPPLEKDSRRDHGDHVWHRAPTYPAYSYQQQATRYDWESNGRGYAFPEPTRPSSDYYSSSNHHLSPHAYAEPAPSYARPSFAPFTSTSPLPALASHLSSLPLPNFSSPPPPFALHPLQSIQDSRPHQHLPPHSSLHSAFSPALPTDWAVISNHGHPDEPARDSRSQSRDADREREEPREGESKWQWSHSSSHVSSHSWNDAPISNAPPQTWDPLPRSVGGQQDGESQHWAGSSMGSLQAISRAASHAASGKQAYRPLEGTNGSRSHGSYSNQRAQEGYDYGTEGSESGSGGGGEKKQRKQRRRNGQPPRDLALRRYACEVCVDEPRSFARPSALKIHMLTHTKEKPHVCPVCSRAFAISSNLKRHRKLHDAEEQAAATAAATERQAERWLSRKAPDAW